MSPMRPAPIVLSGLLCLGLSAQSPQSTPAPAARAAPSLPADPARLLGMTLAQCWDVFGPPARVYPLRGGEPWQDDVVFEYAGGFSLFWFRDRLWQLRFGQGYPDPVYGVTLGEAAERLGSLLGQSAFTIGDSPVYDLPDQGYPVRLRALVEAGKVVELYVYRADF